MICKVKQDVWLRFQRPLLQRFEEQDWDSYGGAGLNLTATVDFHSFRNHPLWLLAEKRRGLSIKATNCEANTPARSSWSTQKWVAAGDAARRELGERWDTSASDMIAQL